MNYKKIVRDTLNERDEIMGKQDILIYLVKFYFQLCMNTVEDMNHVIVLERRKVKKLCL